MSKISLSCCFPQNMTLVPNEFVDGHMSRANGEFVKVYLLLLRLSASGQPFSLSDAADRLSCTEKDILRALRYWENTGVLILSRNVRDEISGVAFAPIGMAEDVAPSGFPASQERKSHPSAGRREKQETQVQPDAFVQNEGCKSTSAPDLKGDQSQGKDYTPVPAPDFKGDQSQGKDYMPVPAPDFKPWLDQAKDKGKVSVSDLESAPAPGLEADQNRNANDATVQLPLEAVQDATRSPSLLVGANIVQLPLEAAQNATANGNNAPGRKQLTAARITELENTSDFMYLLFVSGQYLGRNLTRRDIDTLGYFFDELHMSADLIEYLIEYCVDIGHTNINYIETVGLSWHKKGVKTIEEAKAVAVNYQKDYYTILKALGIRDHSPISSEIQIMDKWMVDYHFSMDMIERACSKTIMTIAKPTIHYADKILTNWFEKGVRTLDDVKKEDEAHKAKRENKQKKKTASPAKGRMPSGSFYHFEQRSYGSDLDDMLVDISAKAQESNKTETRTS
ncbi:MAG: DnaD domain protein [Lachnospiraceae bacterium]|nr:DnaD domain protein [Lachnospiraceae bacterium]